MTLKSILDLSYDELLWDMKVLGEPRFRVSQIWNWIWKRGVVDFSQMTNIPRKLREKMARIYSVNLPQLARVQESVDGTIKFALCLRDGKIIETVLIPERTHYTQCLSSQVGCAMGCRFCSTGRMGFERNLSPGEILSQILVARDYLKKKRLKLKIRNLVFMGMGEPLLNWKHVKKALGVIRHKEGLEFSYRHTTISTVGFPDPLKEFAQGDMGSIAISLHAPTQSLREEIMPKAAKVIEVGELVDFLRTLPMRPRQRITIEYILIKGINDSLECARELNRLLSNLRCKINLIRFNPGEGIGYEPPDEKQIEAFENFLREKGQITTLRKSKGQDINAACGQLKTRMMLEN